MFQAKIISKNLESGVIKVDVEFSDGTDTYVEWCKPENQQTLDNWIKNTINRLDESKAMSESLQVNAIVDTTEPEPVQPTAEEQAATAWVAAYQKLNAATKLKEIAEKNGRPVSAERQTEIDQLAEFVDSNFKDEYVSLI